MRLASSWWRFRKRARRWRDSNFHEAEHDRSVKVVYTGGEEQMVCVTWDADPTIIWDIEQHCPKLHERG